MLDDLAYIHEVDKSDALGIAAKEPDQLTHKFSATLAYSDITSVVYAGMGGSALAASLSVTWPGLKVPFEIVRGYNLPAYVNDHTLLIIDSASGNTEETLSALNEGEAKGAKVVIITGGGKLADIARGKSYPLVIMPAVKQPRYGVFYNLNALSLVLSELNLAAAIEPGTLANAAVFLGAQASEWDPTRPVQTNLAKQMALDCLGKSVVIYGGPLLAPAAYKWKIDFNENAKQVAWCGEYPEFNHNEFIGWSSQPVDKPYALVELRSTLEHPRVQQRFNLSDRLLSGRRPDPMAVNALGSNILEQLLYCVLLGDFVSIYAAIAAGTNPEPVELIERFKVMLAQEHG